VDRAAAKRQAIHVQAAGGALGVVARQRDLGVAHAVSDEEDHVLRPRRVDPAGERRRLLDVAPRGDGDRARPGYGAGAQ
jgi:hypothetical protein